MMFLTLPAMMSLIACQSTTSNPVVLPSLEEYAPEVQDRAGEEYNQLGPLCPRTETTPGCSALRTFINDYKTLRNRIRCASGERPDLCGDQDE